MMILTTVSKQVSKNNTLVYWRVGTKRKGVIDVRTEFTHRDQEIIAELIAIRYLILDKKVFRCVPNTGNGLMLRVSKGAIRKIVQGRSKKRFAARFASLLTGRMSGVRIEVSHGMDFMVDEASPEFAESVEVLNATTKDYASPHETIETPAIGTLGVTHYAVKRFEERLASRSPGETLYRPWTSLFNQLRHPELEKTPLSKKVLRHKFRRYGRNNKVEIWSHPSSTTRFTVVVREDGTKVLVTVFDRADEYM